MIIWIIFFLIGFDIVAVDTLSDEMSLDLLEHFTGKKVVIASNNSEKKPLIKGKTRQEVRTELKIILKVTIERFFDACKQEDAYCGGLLLRNSFDADIAYQFNNVDYDERCLRIQVKGFQDPAGFTILVPRDFEQSFASRSVSKIFFSTQYDDSDFGKLLMICFFYCQKNTLWNRIGYNMKFVDNPCNFEALMQSVDGGGRRISLEGKLACLFCKIPYAQSIARKYQM